MTAVFFLPLLLIALYEAVFRARKNGWMKTWFRGLSEDEDTPDARDPPTHDARADGLQIARTKFEELVRVFPDAAMSQERAIVREVREVRAMVEEVLRRLDEGQRPALGQEGKKKKKAKKSGSSSSSSSD